MCGRALVCFWHFSEVAALMWDVRCWGKSGSRILGSWGQLLTQSGRHAFFYEQSLLWRKISASQNTYCTKPLRSRGAERELLSVGEFDFVGELRRGGHPALSDSSDDIQARKWEAREYLGWAMRPVDHGSGKLG